MSEDNDTEEPILYSVEDKIATITLNRPDKLNAFNTKLLNTFIETLDETDADDNVRAVIVTGAGRAFCAGADLSSGAKTFDYDARQDRSDDQKKRDGGGLVSLRIYESKKPIISAVNGAAVGVGVTMQLPMDIRIASESARFGFVFTRRGVVPEACSSYFLPRIVGISQALEWVYSGRVFNAQEALAGGLVKEVVPDDQLMDRAREVAGEIAQNTSAVSVALARHMLWRMLGADHPMEAHKVDSKGIAQMGAKPDAYEGVASFLEKRPANYTMKVSSDMPDFFPWWEEREFDDA